MIWTTLVVSSPNANNRTSGKGQQQVSNLVFWEEERCLTTPASPPLIASDSTSGRRQQMSHLWSSEGGRKLDEICSIADPLIPYIIVFLDPMLEIGPLIHVPCISCIYTSSC